MERIPQIKWLSETLKRFVFELNETFRQWNVCLKLRFTNRFFNYRAIAHSEEPTNQVLDLDPRHTNSITGGSFNDINVPLRKKQRRLVNENPGVLKALQKAMKMAINECQNQFKDRRWNCPTTDYMKGKGIFGKIVQRGTHLLLFDFCLAYDYI